MPDLIGEGFDAFGHILRGAVIDNKSFSISPCPAESLCTVILAIITGENRDNNFGRRP